MRIGDRSGSQEGLVPIGKQLVTRLRAMGVERAHLLADEGENIVKAIESWPISSPAEEDKSKTWIAMLDWHGRALSFLTGSR